MKENKKSGGKTAIIIILIILLLGMIGYVVYDKFIKEEPKTTEETKKEENKKDENETYSVKNKSTVQVLYLDSLTVYVSKNGEAFATFNKDSDSLDATQKSSIEKLIKQYQEYPLEGYDNPDCGTSDKSNFIKAVKLPITNVMAAYESLNGQDEQGYYVLFTKEDGTVSGLKVSDLLYDSKITIVDNVNNLKNIVSIAKSFSTSGCSGFSQTIALDKSGNQHILNLYE